MKLIHIFFVVSFMVPSGMDLAEGESVLWYGRRSFKSLWPWLLLGVLTIWIFGLGLIFFLIAVWKWWRTEFAVTNHRVYSKYGVVGREARDVPYEKVTDASLSQGFFGRILNYGDIRINTAGSVGYEIKFTGISDPKGLRGKIRSFSEDFKEEERIQERIERIEDRYLTGEISKEQFERAKKRLKGERGYKKEARSSEKTRFCTECGSEISKEAKFCPKCGARVTEEEEEKRPVKKCPNCGSEIESGAKFCIHCGTRIEGGGED